MLFSKTTGYGIRAIIYLAKQTESNLCGLQEIAEHENIPSAYLGKILGDLRKNNLLNSVKGIHGGYELALPADSITLWDIYKILEPVSCEQCVLGLSVCAAEIPCALHDSWMPLKDGFVNMLKTKTIAQIVE